MLEPKNVEELSVEELNELFAAACRAQEEGDLARAKADYQRLLGRFQDAPVLHVNLGLVCFQLRDFAGAVSCFAKAASLAEDDMDILFNLSLALRRQGDISGAIDGYRRILAQEPQALDALYNLGGCYRDKGEEEEAIRCYRQLLHAAPDNLAASNTLAYLYHRQGNKPLAIRYYRQVLALEPAHPGARYMLAALEGNRDVVAPPPGYVRDVFDRYAENFEQSLVQELEYRVPTQLRELCQRHLPENFRVDRLLDLGCGTGLSGMAFTDFAQLIDGVDLSANMLEIAAEKKIYAGLVEADIENFLAGVEEKYHFFLACDVLSYLGRLENFFAAIFAAALPGACLCFSTEQYEGTDFCLQETGRFAHNPEYIRTRCQCCGFTLLAEESAALRRERASLVAGKLWLVQRPYRPPLE